MLAAGRVGSTRGRMAMAVGCTALFGALGAALVLEGYLLTMPLPRSATARAWRTLGLTALSTGVAAGLVGGLVALAAGFPWVYAGLAGTLAGLVGLGLGSMAGLVVSWDGYRREAPAA